jgi:hypothetical protein
MYKNLISEDFKKCSQIKKILGVTLGVTFSQNMPKSCSSRKLYPNVKSLPMPFDDNL